MLRGKKLECEFLHKEMSHTWISYCFNKLNTIICWIWNAKMRKMYMNLRVAAVMRLKPQQCERSAAFLRSTGGHYHISYSS